MSNKLNNKSPLRYPGGKTRACKILDSIIDEYFTLDNYDTILSPFFGGGSFEFFLQNKYNKNLIVNDKFVPLYSFWKECKENKKRLCKILEFALDKITKDDFIKLREKIMSENDSLIQAVYYFIINRCSFSGATLSGGFSQEASTKRFTESSITRIKSLNLQKFSIYNEDFNDFIENNYSDKTFIFLDPPYYLEKGSKLYGKKGDMHETFDHEKLFKCMESKDNWMMTYNNCEYIKNLYKDFTIIEVNWAYGMCNVQSKKKKEKAKMKECSEIVIIG